MIFLPEGDGVLILEWVLPPLAVWWCLSAEEERLRKWEGFLVVEVLVRKDNGEDRRLKKRERFSKW